MDLPDRLPLSLQSFAQLLFAHSAGYRAASHNHVNWRKRLLAEPEALADDALDPLSVH